MTENTNQKGVHKDEKKQSESSSSSLEKFEEEINSLLEGNDIPLDQSGKLEEIKGQKEATEVTTEELDEKESQQGEESKLKEFQSETQKEEPVERENIEKPEVSQIEETEKKLETEAIPEEVSTQKEAQPQVEKSQQELSPELEKEEVSQEEFTDLEKITPKQLNALASEKQIEILLEVAKKIGVEKALSLAQKATDPFVIDSFHDKIVAEGLVEK